MRKKLLLTLIAVLTFCLTAFTLTACGNACNHSFTNYISNNDATFDSDGTKTATCDNGCGKTDTITDVGSKLTATSASAFAFDNGTITGLTDYGKSLTKIVIPKTINDIAVTSIGSSAFSGCRSLTSIEIPNSVTSIGNYAFKNCTLLQSVEIPNSVTSIGYEVFCGCSSLQSVEIPNSVTSIDAGAFRGCYSLTRIEIPNSVTSIGYNAFSGCDYLIYNVEGNLKYLGNDTNKYSYLAGVNLISITTATINQSCKIIGNYAFENCTSLQSIEIPNSVTSIGSYAFYACRSLQSVTIGNSVTSIGSYAFRNCTSLTRIEIPNSVTSIGYNAFSGCDYLIYNVEGNLKYLGSETNKYLYLAGVNSTSITTATINQSCRLIENHAFSGCSKLTSIEIPNSVTSIGEYAFENCTSLQSIEIPNSVTTIDDYAFYGCTSLTYNVEGDLKYLGNETNKYLYLASVNSTSITTATINQSCKIIGYNAFEDCTSLTSIEIPNNVTSIGGYAFSDCTALTIYCEAESKPSDWNSSWNYSNCPVVWNLKNNDVADDGYIYTVIEGLRYGIKKGVATVVEQATNITTANIPASITYKGTTYNVTSIGYSVFGDCTSLQSVIIPNSVTSISYCAFYNCTSLQSIEIPNSVTTIEDYAFYNCSSLESIVIPNSVTGIGFDAFYGCTSLTIYCEASAKPSGWSAYWNSSNRPVVWSYKPE